jgi:hypothetical protein
MPEDDSTIRGSREALSEERRRHEELRQQIAKLEERVESLGKRLARYEIGLEKAPPMLASVMREGVPLEIFTRLALIEAGFLVRGFFQYHSFNSDGSSIERSVDVYATRDSTYTVPADRRSRAGESWPERNHLLVESKQRRPGVTWIFCQLPGCVETISGAPSDVPLVNFGYELRPGVHAAKEADASNLKPRANTKDVENGIEQLEYAYIPKLIEIEREWSRDNKRPHPVSRLAPGVRHDHLWCVLVTNARLMLFKPPKTFAELESGSPPRDDALFAEAPWLVFQRAPSLRLLSHQARYLGHVPEDTPDRHICPPVVMAEHAAQIHVVNFNQLPRFLSLVNDPPRIKEIVIKLSVAGSGVESQPIKIS